MRIRPTIFLLLALILPLVVPAQDYVDVVSDLTNNTEGNLNAAIQARIDVGTLSSAIFRLELYGVYILNGTITVPDGQKLTIIAPDPGTTQLTAPPMILWTSSSVTQRYNIDCYGELYMKNIWIIYATTGGAQVGSSLEFNDSPDSLNERGTFINCIFDYSLCPGNASGAVGVSARHFKGYFTDCYFRNCIDPHYRYYGRAVSFPYNTTGYHIDSLAFVNCTFANMGYVYMQEGSEYGDYVKFNHCTFLNTVVYTLESGWWHWLSVTNCAFVNPYMFSDLLYLRGTGSNANFPDGGTIRVDTISTFGFSVPFTEAERHILFSNNSYVIQPWLLNYYQPGANLYTDTASAAYLPRPQPMMSDRTLGHFADDVTWPYLSLGTNYDNVDPGFLLPPTNEEGIKRFLLKKWTDNSDTNWAFNPTADWGGVWPMNESFRYTNTTLRGQGMNGLPVGSLRWWNSGSPNRYALWKAQEITENQRIDIWLTTGVDPGVLAVPGEEGLPLTIELSQNYPNPFNPTTQIDYTIPERSDVSLKVFDLLGQEVATLVTGYQEAGKHSVTFDGATLSSGVYFYKLQSGSSTISKKLVLMK